MRCNVTDFSMVEIIVLWVSVSGTFLSSVRGRTFLLSENFKTLKILSYEEN